MSLLYNCLSEGSAWVYIVHHAVNKPAFLESSARLRSLDRSRSCRVALHGDLRRNNSLKETREEKKINKHVRDI